MVGQKDPRCQWNVDGDGGNLICVQENLSRYDGETGVEEMTE